MARTYTAREVKNILTTLGNQTNWALTTWLASQGRVSGKALAKEVEYTGIPQQLNLLDLLQKVDDGTILELPGYQDLPE